MKRLLAAVLALILAAFAVHWGIEQRRAQAFEVQRAALHAESERLRASVETQRNSEPSELSQRAEIEKTTARIRRLNFQRPVEYDVLSRQKIKETLSAKIAEQFSDAEFANVSAGYAALGLLPRGYPLKQKYVELLGEQVAAFYDQHQHKLFMFEDATLANAQNRVVLAHELTHALQDQNFGLQKLPLEAKDNDDRALAASALIEGDATLVMSEYMMANLSWRTLRDSVGGLLSQNMEQLEKAPRFLRETLLFSYLRGQEFCAAVQARGGYAALSAAYQKPPASTAQILHPAKYFADEQPIRIEWNDTTVNGEKPIADNVLGEFGTRILLSENGDAKRAEDIAAGWHGDRYLVFHQPEMLVWRTRWEDAAAAEKFFNALQEFLQKRYDAELIADEVGVLAGNSRNLPHPRRLKLARSGTSDVLLIDAENEASLNEAAAKF